MSKYHHLTVEKIVRETPDAISIHFRQPATQRLTYKAGQFLTLLVPVGGTVERRSYSMCSSPLTDHNLVVSVKRTAGGKVSNHLNDTLKAGDTLEVMEPAGNFHAEPDATAHRHIVLLGAGSGITPLLSIAKTLLHGEPQSRVSLLYGNRNRRSVIFYDELAALQQQYAARLEVIHVLSQPEAGWQGHTGRLNQSLALKILENLPRMPRTEYFLCGPDGMMHEMKQALAMLRVAEASIHSESFAGKAPDAHGQVLEQSSLTVQDQQVTVMYEGTEYKFKVPASKTILEAALANNIDLPYSCQSGLCTACMGRCLSGKVKLDEEEGLSETELREGYVLTCVGHPLTADVVIEIE